MFFYVLFSVFAIVFCDSGICESPEGVKCDCQSFENEMKISNCWKKGEWSNWSIWSKCRSGIQKRRRKCNNPAPLGIGQFCRGDSLEKRTCSDIPEYIFNSWTSWNEWTTCDCSKKQQSRIRFCQNESCEGCNFEQRDCSKDCPDVRKWTKWSAWFLDVNGNEVRFSAYTSSNFGIVELVQEKRERIQENIQWSNWKFTSNIAYRFRVLSETVIDFEHYMIHPKINTLVPIYITMFVGGIGFICGFTVQCFLSWIFGKISSYRSVSSDYSSGQFY